MWRLGKRAAPSDGLEWPPNVRDTVTKLIAPSLKRQGYVRNGQTFYQTIGELTRIINLQSNSYNTNEDGTFSLNFSVHHPRAYEAEYGDPAPRWPKEYTALLRLEVEGIPANATYAYKRGDDLQALAQTICDAIIDKAVPYLSKIQTIDDVINLLGTKAECLRTVYSHVHKGIAHAIAGQPEIAREHFQTYIDGNDRADAKAQRNVATIAEQFGITIACPKLGTERRVDFYFSVKGAEPINNERRTRNKLELFLDHLTRKGYGYTSYWGSRSREGTMRISFYAEDTGAVAAYIKARADKFPEPLLSIETV